MARKHAKAAKAAKKAKSNGAVKAHTFNPEHKIHLLVKANPKRKDSKEHARFGRYKSGMRVSEAKEKGIANNLNLTIDTAKGYIKVGA